MKAHRPHVAANRIAQPEGASVRKQIVIVKQATASAILPNASTAKQKTTKMGQIANQNLHQLLLKEVSK